MSFPRPLVISVKLEPMSKLIIVCRKMIPSGFVLDTKHTAISTFFEPSCCATVQRLQNIGGI